jgi:hypothetical protein
LLKYQGKGKLVMKDGTSVEANFTNGEIHGFGTKRWTDGRVYEGIQITVLHLILK